MSFVTTGEREGGREGGGTKVPLPVQPTLQMSEDGLTAPGSPRMTSGARKRGVPMMTVCEGRGGDGWWIR